MGEKWGDQFRQYERLRAILDYLVPILTIIVGGAVAFWLIRHPEVWMPK